MVRRHPRSIEKGSEERGSFFVTYLPMFLDYLQVEKGLAKNSLAAYRADLRHFAHWLGERNTGLENVERIDIVRYFQTLRRAGVSARSVARALAAIRGLFRFLVAERHLSLDPTENIENPKLWSTLPKSLTAGEVEALLRAPQTDTAAGLRDRAMLELLYATGLRVSELIRVKVADLVLDAGFLRTLGKGSKE
ncbi:MAG TPA: site-specific integrase, partial [Thermoanaerobaculia bacterium]|nr:site-specific integrase [Thermoanaerobaculia bacterium]